MDVDPYDPKNESDDDGNDNDDNDDDDNNDEYDQLEQVFEKSLRREPSLNSFWSSTVSPLNKDERDFLKQFIVEMSEVRLKKSIPNSHVEELGTVIANNFVKAFEYSENIRNIMARYCSSCYLQNNFLELQDSYVQPTQITTSDDQLSIQYFSVEGILKSIINQHPSLIDSIEKEKSLNFIPEQNRKNMVIRNELDTTY
nr:uncharacterized protein LOC124497322 [Dermatophagoides farinae]